MSKNKKTYAGLTTQSDAEQIQRYVLGMDAQISDKLKQKLERLQIAADMLRKYGSRMKVATALQNLWPADCSRATAYRYIEEAQEVFAPQQAANREFYVDILMGQLFSTHEKALAKGDLKTAAAVEKNIIVAIIKFFGTSDALPLEKLQAPSYTLGFLPESVNASLPADYLQQLERIMKTRKVGVVADQDAVVVPATDSEQPPAEPNAI
jgi:hypothetical protein